MSEEGYQKLVAELKHLESVERPKIVAAIAEARDKGDLSENAEYDAAKEAQGLLEMKINQLKATIGDAKIIDTSKLKNDTVQILSRVELKNVKTGNFDIQCHDTLSMRAKLPFYKYYGNINQSS